MHFKNPELSTHAGSSFNTCPLFSHPRPLCIKSFFLKRFLVAAADNVPPHKLSSLSCLPSPHFSGAGSLAGSPNVHVSVRRCRSDGVLDSAHLLPVNGSILTDSKEQEKWSVEMKKWAGRRISVKVRGGVLGPWLGGLGGRFLSGCLQIGWSGGVWSLLIKTTH